MKLSLQQKKMEEISDLLSQDLSYIFSVHLPTANAPTAADFFPLHGEREAGPNGEKKDFLRKSAAFLRKLGKDLGFSEMSVHTNKAGIACSGEVTLYGIWCEGNGLYFEIAQNNSFPQKLLYREIKHLNDSTGGQNKWLSLLCFQNADYEGLCNTFLSLKRKEEKRNAA